MTYIPQVQGHSDLAYFEDLGLIGGSTGMAPIISQNGADTWGTPDETYGTAAVISTNVLKWGAASADSWVGYSLGATYDKVLMITYTITSTSHNIYPCLISKNALDNTNSAVSNDFYMTNQTSTTQLHKRTGGSWTQLGASDATIYTAIIVSTPAFGTALYVEDGTQKMFMKFGSTSEWFPILSASDGDSTSFQSVAIWTSAKNMRCTTPFLVWGA